MLKAQCFERIIDPSSHESVAACGWISESHGLIRYWVSIERRPYNFFSDYEVARKFFKLMTGAILKRFKGRKPHA